MLSNMKSLLIVAAALLFAGAARAEEVDLMAPVLNVAGQIEPSSNAKDAPPLTVKIVIEQALSMQPPLPGQDPGAAAASRLAAFSLALRVHSATRMSFTSEEISQIKAAVSQVYPSPIVFGRIVEAIDPAAIKPAAGK